MIIGYNDIQVNVLDHGGGLTLVLPRLRILVTLVGEDEQEYVVLREGRIGVGLPEENTHVGSGDYRTRPLTFRLVLVIIERTMLH